MAVPPLSVGGDQLTLIDFPLAAGVAVKLVGSEGASWSPATWPAGDVRLAWAEPVRPAVSDVMRRAAAAMDAARFTGMRTPPSWGARRQPAIVSSEGQWRAEWVMSVPHGTPISDAPLPTDPLRPSG